MGNIVRTDLHNHWSQYHTVSARTFERVVARAQKTLGIGGVLGLTNYNKTTDYEKFADLRGGPDRYHIGPGKTALYLPRHDLTISKTQEVETKTSGGDMCHLLVVGIGKNRIVKPFRTPEDTVKEARGMGGFCIVDHGAHFQGMIPYLIDNQDLLSEIAALETHNGEAALGIPLPILQRFLPPGANESARNFYDEVSPRFPDLGEVAFSDGHTVFEIGSSYTEIKQPRKDGNFVSDLEEAIKGARRNSQHRENSIIGAAYHSVCMLPIMAQQIFSRDSRE